MLYIGGLIFALLCVFGSFAASGGALAPLLASMPFELLTILGAAVGVFVMSNSMAALKSVFGYLMLVVKGPRHSQQSYMDLLALMYRLLRQANMKGIASLENDFEEPQESSIFATSPRIKQDEKTRDMICDYLRLISMNLDESHQLDEIMGRELKKNLHEDLHVAESLSGISDALPALGIVAAVLGVVKTMAAISKPPAVLGEMIAGALVGTFLGVLLAYGVVGPLASRMQAIVKMDNRYYETIRTVLVAYLQGQPPQVCIEIGRKDIPEEFMPGFAEVDSMLSELT
ncbi:flagellar motor stator protein MotA [Parasaccharibacter sp. TMW2.1882]|uniref:Flagellar motor rotation protein MotA n=2 Tax=Acetobacteraceae TaxID=433 RepID=A0A7U7G4M0_9PROT|nr:MULTISPECIES: flagellar motor stator protein MotA [Acetobacteraceae]MCL1562380.1 flagellar motor stator protein MotA [Parasaccharibacter sp. TMW 2.1886]MCQ0040903.1 flagellar motor stator protein MotA [Bombella sp.]MUG79923.1 flagellar motor stator protein MotA [Bombella sp. ESL0380]MUH03276.1 flagellar motor stator protein MotA [Bombella sp. ESL0387]QGT75522.1 flagellar motor stator protein MotA [Bombella sp. ESL0368]